MNKNICKWIVILLIASTIAIACAPAPTAAPSATRAAQVDDEVTHPTSVFEELPYCRIFTEGDAYANWHTSTGDSQVRVRLVGTMDSKEDPSKMYVISLDFPGFRVDFHNNGVEVNCVTEGGVIKSTFLKATIGDLFEILYSGSGEKSEKFFAHIVEGGRWQLFSPPLGPQARTRVARAIN